MAMNSTNKQRARIPAFKGIYRRNGAQDGHLADTRNMTTDAYPALTVRPGREPVNGYDDVADAYYVGGKLYVVQGGKLVLDGDQPQPLCEVIDGAKQWALVNKWLVIWPDRITVDIYTGEVRNIGEKITAQIQITESGGISVNGAAPSSDQYIDLEESEYWEAPFGNPFPANPTSSERYWLRRYDTCSKVGGVFSVTPSGGTVAYPAVGDWFIGPAPRVRTYSSIPEDDLTDGSQPYGRISRVERLNEQTHTGDSVPGQYMWKQKKWTLRIYFTSLATSADFGSLFETGDTVKLKATSDDHFFYNDRYYMIDDVEDGSAKISGHIYAANYLTLEADLAPGVYAVDSSRRYLVTDTLRAGQQLFLVVTPAASGLIENVLYCYDPVTEVLSSYDPTQSTATRTLTFNAYSSSTPFNATIERECPDLDYICEHGNRLYGVSNREEQKVWNSITGQYETFQSRVLHASELGYPTRWNTFRGTAADSYSVAIGGDGDFTAIADYGGAVIAFKEYKAYKITGEYPAEFYLRSYDYNGIKAGCHRSLCVIGQVLYYLSPAGVMAYTGSAPSLVSYPLGMEYNSGAVGGRDRVHYYLCVTRAGGDSDFFVYDTVHGLWMLADHETVDTITQYGDRALLVIGRQLMQTDYGDSDETVKWRAELAETDEGTYAKKQYSEIQMDAELGQDTVMHVLYQTDEESADEWHLLATVTAVEGNLWQHTGRMGGPIRNRWQLPVQNLRCDRLRIKLEGRGAATIYSLERTFSLQSDRT